MTTRTSGGHDLYVTDATFALSPLTPRVLLRCVRCGRLGTGLIETQRDRDYAATRDRQFDAGEWWCFEHLRIVGSVAASCPHGGGDE